MKIAIRCTACQAAYLFEESEAPAHGELMQCSECGAAFRVRRQGTIPGGTPAVGRIGETEDDTDTQLRGARQTRDTDPGHVTTSESGRRRRVTLSQGLRPVSADDGSSGEPSPFPSERTRPGVRPTVQEGADATAPPPAERTPGAPPRLPARATAPARPSAEPTRDMRPLPGHEGLADARVGGETRDMNPLGASQRRPSSPPPIQPVPRPAPINRAPSPEILAAKGGAPRENAIRASGAAGSEWYLNAVDESTRAPAPEPDEYTLGDGPIERAPSATGEWETIPAGRSNILSRDVEITDDVPALKWAPDEHPRSRSRWVLLALLVLVAGGVVLWLLLPRPDGDSAAGDAADAVLMQDEATRTEEGARAAQAHGATRDDESTEEDSEARAEMDASPRTAPGEEAAAASGPARAVPDPAEREAGTAHRADEGAEEEEVVPAAAEDAVADAAVADDERAEDARSASPEPREARREPSRQERRSTLVRQARDAENAGQFERALSLWSDAEQLDSSGSEIQLGIARTYLGMGRPELAVARSNRILASNPRFAPALLVAGDAYRAMGQRAEAIEAYREATRVAPGSTSGRSAARRLEAMGAQP